MLLEEREDPGVRQFLELGICQIDEVNTEGVSRKKLFNTSELNVAAE